MIIEPGNPYDFTADELEELRQVIVSADPGADVQIAVRPERGYGVTLQEVLYVWDVATDVVGDLALLGTPVAAAVAWLRRRAKKERDAGMVPPRTRVAVLLGPDGKPLSRVIVEDPDNEPRVEQADSEEPRHRPAVQ